MRLLATGYNWRNTLGDYAQTAGILAGFCVTIIVFIFGWNVAETPVFCTVTYAQVAVLIIGIASALFIAAMECFLSAKNYDLWNLPDRYHENLEKNLPDWDRTLKHSIKACRKYEAVGRYAYNLAILLLFVGLAFTFAPFNMAIAVLVGLLGICLQFIPHLVLRMQSKAE